MNSITVCRAQRQRPANPNADQYPERRRNYQPSKLLALSLRCSSHRCLTLIKSRSLVNPMPLEARRGTVEHAPAMVHPELVADLGLLLRGSHFVASKPELPSL